MFCGIDPDQRANGVRVVLLAAALTIFPGLHQSGQAHGAMRSDAEYFIDCENPAGKLEFLICANPGVFDTLNHFHQMLSLAADSAAGQSLHAEYFHWIQSLQDRCLHQPNVSKQVDCLQEAAMSREMHSFETRINALYEGVSDIEGDDECDGCAENSAVDEQSLTVPIPRPRPPAAVATSAPANPSMPASSGLFPDAASPMEFVRAVLAADEKTAEMQIRGFYTDFWGQIATYAKKRSADLTRLQSPPPDAGWQVSDSVDPLTRTSFMLAEKQFEWNGATSTLRLSCDTRKKQLDLAFFDTTLDVGTLGLPQDAAHVADFNILYAPPPAGYPEKQVFNSKPRLNGRSLTIVGFNSNGWGASLCDGSANIAYNSPFCRWVDAKLPDHLRQLAASTNVRVGGLKQRALVPESWAEFREIRFSLRTVWGNPAYGRTIPAQYYFSIEPNREPVRSLLAACERQEDRCVAIPDESEARACTQALEREISQND